MTMLLSVFGMAGRRAGDLLTTALGWASSLLFGRVPRSHQVLLLLMMALSFLWLVFLLGFLVPSVASALLASTPHPSFIDRAWLALTLVVGLVVLPLLVGVAGYLVPSRGERVRGGAMVIEVLRGYLLAPVVSGLLIFLAGIGIARKVRSQRHGWSDVHVPIVAKPRGYDRIVDDLVDALADAGLPVQTHDAPRVLTLPARVLTAVAGRNVRELRADRLVELTRASLRIGVYPSDIAISGPTRERTRARAAILGRLATTAAHQTTSAEAQRAEDEIEKVAESGRARPGRLGPAAREALDAFDANLLDLSIPTDEWDILYRLRLQVERDLLAGSESAPAAVAHGSGRKPG